MTQVLKVLGVADIHGNSVGLAKAAGLARDHDCDVILIAGDIIAHEIYGSFMRMLDNMVRQAGRPCIFTPGNHDKVDPETFWNSAPYISGEKQFGKNSVCCLIEQSVMFKGFKIYGSPYVNTVNPGCKGRWMYERDPHEMHFDIPYDTDIVVTHSPPFGYCDKVKGAIGERIGSEALAQAIAENNNVKLCICGHNHSPSTGRLNDTIIANCSICYADPIGRTNFGVDWNGFQIIEVTK